MTLADLSYRDLLHVASNMRAMDRREIYATRWNDDPKELAASCMNPVVKEFAKVAFWGKVPVAAIGAAPIWPGVWSVWMFATDDFPKVSLSLHRYVVNTFAPTLRRHCHRAECRSLAAHTEAHRWLTSLGAAQEATLLGFGKNREDFHVFAWHNW